MKMTSAEAAKRIRQLNEEMDMLLAEETESREFVAAIQESLEDARPAYDFAGTQQKLDEIEQQIRAIKHALNVFNTTHTIPGTDMTVDQALVYLPQLNRRKDKLAAMCGRLEKSRVEKFSASSNVIEYSYANYSIPEAKAALKAVSDEIVRLQFGLDRINTHEEMEIPESLPFTQA